MFFIKAAYCRAFQTVFRIALPLLPYREPHVLNSSCELEKVFERERSKSVLIITDKGIVSNGLVSPIEAVVQSCKLPCTVYDGTLPNPTVANVEEAFEMYRRNKCDTIIAVGGGSAMDCAKAVGVRVAYPKKSLEKKKGILRVMRSLPTLVAVPTTAGTGSETTLAAIITDPENKHKYALMSFPLIPHYALLDPELTVSLPPHLTATTGVDALTHAVEAYIGRSTTRETRRLAEEAVKLVFENVEKAYRDGSDLVARENMLHAAYKAGIAFSKSYVGYIHAVAHSLGGRYGTPHGLANAVIMPYVLDAYGECVHKKLHSLGVAAGVCERDDSQKLGAKKFIQAVRDLNAKMSIPEKLNGIRNEDIPEMARKAEKEANPLYPVPCLMTAEELSVFYHKISDRSKVNE